MGSDASRRSRLRSLARWAVGALALLAVLGALHRSHERSDAAPDDSLARRRAVAEAAGLLAAPVPSGVDDARGDLADATALDAPVSLASLRRFVRASVPAGTTGAIPALDPAQPDAVAPGAGPQAFPMRARPRPSAGTPSWPIAPPASAGRIPDAIEGVASGRRDADALASLTIDAQVRMLDGQVAPFLAQAVKTAPQPARVQLRPRAPDARAQADGGWFEVGDAPAPGWRIVRIDERQVDLLTPLGNPVRLRVAPDAVAPGN
jgi:hypothetical protein